MTILITNLEDGLEDITDDEMQQLSGGISISFEVSLLEASDTKTGSVLTDIAVGAGNLLSSLTQRVALAATDVRGIAQDPTTRRI
ncbi:MAG TPA: hypothetical protein V6C91_16860 [Coleofasciculaceae cyanobacterium]